MRVGRSRTALWAVKISSVHRLSAPRSYRRKARPSKNTRQSVPQNASGVRLPTRLFVLKWCVLWLTCGGKDDRIVGHCPTGFIPDSQPFAGLPVVDSHLDDVL